MEMSANIITIIFALGVKMWGGIQYNNISSAVSVSSEVVTFSGYVFSFDGVIVAENATRDVERFDGGQSVCGVLPELAGARICAARRGRNGPGDGRAGDAGLQLR